jgi:DNA-binding transcriptional ArsR family regulator
VEKAWLESELASGRSIEAIAREAGKHPSTVAYWVGKHGLASQHAARHAARGGIERSVLEPLVEQGLSTRDIAAAFGVSQATVRHWLARHGLKVMRARSRPAMDAGTRVCPIHGPARFVRQGGERHLRCVECRKQRVMERRRRVKEILVEEAGGGRRLCGYDRYLGALQFHHVDPDQKSFGLALRGVSRSLERCRAEAAKCVLLCANCHAEIEAGIVTLP